MTILEGFGFLEKTGIDMQGEMDTSSLIWPRRTSTPSVGHRILRQRFR